MAYDTNLDSADSRLNVRFYQKAVQNNFKTALEGRPIMEMADFVVIEVPGNTLTVIDTYAAPEHKDRFPMQWARYQNEKTDGDIEGTLLSDWPVLNAASAAELKHFKFYTVEQVAQASDAQLNTIGMSAGMSPLSLRDKAKAFLASAKDTAYSQQQAEKLAQQNEIIARMEAQIAELANQVNKPKAKAKKAEVEETTTEE